MKWILRLAILAGTASVVISSQAAPRPARPTRLKAAFAETTTLSRRVAVLLQQNNTRELSRYVDPVRGLRFSPELPANKADVKLSRRQVAALKNDKKVRVWGDYYGEPDPIRLNWDGYRKRFVTARDFTRGVRLSVNPKYGRFGLPIEEQRQFYPGAVFVELYAPPTSSNKMDWASLWMVWHKSGGTWRLLGIAHEEWQP